MSIEELRLLMAQERARFEEERSRLATAMHNKVSQGLTVLTMELALMQQRVAEAEGDKIAGLLEVVAGVNQSVRGITAELYPRVLDEFGLVAALQSECRRLATEWNVPVKFACDVPEPVLSRAVAIEIFRLVQRVLVTMIGASREKDIAVRISPAKDALSFSITQNESGTYSNLAEETFNGVRERALWLGGELGVQSNRQGLVVTFRIPDRTGPVTI